MLKVQASQHAPSRSGMVGLDELGRQAELREAIRTVDLQEETALVLEDLRTQNDDAVQVA